MNNIFKFTRFILEKYLNNVNFSEIVNKTYLELQAQKNFLNAYAIDYTYEETGKILDPDDDLSDVIETKDFQDWLKYELETKFEDLYYDVFMNLIDQNSYITLYRFMKVDNDYLNKLMNCKIKRIGRYWTYDINTAEPHWGYNNDKRNEIIFEIKIKEEHIDWVETFRLNLEHHYYNEEKEIRLFKNTPINITKIIWNNKEINIPKCKNIIA
jgi:hypothetical protein